jgi:hypothetical protein
MQPTIETRFSARSVVDATTRLRALRARQDAAPHGRYGGPPTGWGRWPTCARDTRAADGSCC